MKRPKTLNEAVINHAVSHEQLVRFFILQDVPFDKMLDITELICASKDMGIANNEIHKQINKLLKDEKYNWMNEYLKYSYRYTMKEKCFNPKCTAPKGLCNKTTSRDTGACEHYCYFDQNYAYSCHHGPTGEEWWVIGINESTGECFPAGYPPTIAKISDCTNWVKEKYLSTDERKARLRKMSIPLVNEFTLDDEVNKSDNVYLNMKEKITTNEK